jgi:hypothetical protein
VYCTPYFYDLLLVTGHGIKNVNREAVSRGSIRTGSQRCLSLHDSRLDPKDARYKAGACSPSRDARRLGAEPAAERVHAGGPPALD